MSLSPSPSSSSSSSSLQRIWRQVLEGREGGWQCLLGNESDRERNLAIGQSARLWRSVGGGVIMMKEVFKMILILPPDIYDTPSHDSMTHPCSRQTFWRNMSAVGHNVVQCLTSKDVAIHGGRFLTKLMYSDLNSNNSCRGDFFETEELWECEMRRDIWIKSRKIIIVPHPSHPAHHLARIHILKMRNPINVRQEQDFWGNIVNIRCRFSF